MSLNKWKCTSGLLFLKKVDISAEKKDKAINSETFCHFVCSMAGQNVLQVSNPMCVYHESRIAHVNWNSTDG